jgi:hypothetical protein
MKKLINIIFILFLFPAMVSGQELIELYKKGKITLTPDPEFSLHLKATPIENEIKKFNDWLNSKAFGLERKNFIKDFAIDQEGDLYLLGSYSQGVVFKFDKHGNYISMLEYGENPNRMYAWGHSIDILDNEYIVVTTNGPILIFNTAGTLYRTIRLDYMVRDCIALRDNKIAVIGEELLDGSGKWKQHVSIIDIKTEKEVKVINFFEEKKNMFISVQNDKRRMTMRNPFRDFNTCIDRTEAGDLIVGYPEDSEIHIFSPDGDKIGLIKLDYPAIPITQTEKDDHYNVLIAFNSERKIEINADELKVIKSNDYFPEHWPYYYDIKVDTDDNILVFKYTKDKDQTFRVYRVYSKEGNFICETTIDSADYRGPNIGRMKFFKGDLYGLLSQKNDTKEEALVKIGLTGRSGADVSQSRQSTLTRGKWTWVSGDSKDDQPGIYGTKGIAASANKPGARYDSVTWTDSKGNFWLYGGRSYKGRGDRVLLNDLWKFDGTNWTWVSGDNDVNRPAVYGTKGVAASTNSPGSRAGSVGWTDSKGNLWLFGGVGFFGRGLALNDLWKFDGKNWTWVSGDSEARHRGIYGTRGIAASTNSPGSRAGSVSWTDSEDNLWLFGGTRYDVSRFSGFLNDLWKFDGTNWTWVSGDSKDNRPGIYGTRGIAASTNSPGSRAGSVSWTDNKGNLWLFGGLGRSWYYNGSFLLNDLWKFDGTNWTWVSGDKVHFSGIPVYGTSGTRGVPADTNKPGARYGSVSWTDSKGNLWLFGGFGYSDSGNEGALNDLWKYDGTNWTWVSGDNTIDHYGIYGTKGVANDTNKPGTRFDSMSWVDSKGNLWLFGGQGYRNSLYRVLQDSRELIYHDNSFFLNDLWKFEP